MNLVAARPNAAGGDPWYLRLVHALPDIAGIMGGVVAAIALAGLVRSRYRRTLGRRRDAYERLSRLGTGVTLEFFTSVLGGPPAVKRQVTSNVPELIDGTDKFQRVPKDFWECFYIDRNYYVQVISDEHETVFSFSITTRRKRFNPVFHGTPYPSWWERVQMRVRSRARYEPLFKVKLGKTHFAEIQAWGPPKKVSSWLAARIATYSEIRYFGNPGYYQTYVFTASTAGAGRIGSLGTVAADPELGIGGNLTWPDPDVEADEQDFEAIPGLAAFRRETVVTTYTVIGPYISEDDYPSSFGPHGDEVRAIP
jgi:hypothetical protein